MSTEAQFSAVIVDSSRLLLDSLTIALPAVGNVTVQASAQDRVEGLFLAKVHRPRLFVVGASTSGVSLELLSGMVTQASPTTRIVVSDNADAPELPDVLACSAIWGVVDSRSSIDAYSEALATAASSRRRPSSHRASIQAGPARRGAVGPLSARELEVLELISVGSSNSGIAAELYISTGTVKRHVANIYSKLDVNSRVEALRAGVALGLLQVPQSGTR